MAKPVSVSFPVLSFRHVESPFQKLGYRDYYAVVSVEDLPDLTDWRRINVRDPKLTGSVPRAIRAGFHESPELFLFMNRGLVLSAEKVSFDNKTSTITLNLTEPRLHGLLDGGHTYNIIVNEREKLDNPQYVKIEILEGFEHDDIIQVVDARNTSNQVRDESLMNLDGAFDSLKTALRKQPYFQDIAFKEYEIGEDGEPKPIDIREVIAILTAFDADNFNDQTHPINTYRSKAACLKHFKDHSLSYKKIYPLATEILQLFDEIQIQLPELYNKARGKSGDVSGGKFGKLTGVTMYERALKLPFSGKETKYGVPDGFVYPILGGFRAMLEEKKGRYVWGKGLDPAALVTGPLGEKLAVTIGNFALDAQNPSKTGKSPLVWQSCYQSVELDYLRA